MDRVKNQLFTLNVFKQLTLIRNSAQLFFVGEGSIEDELKTKTHDWGLDNQIHFLGVRKDVPNLMNALDVLLVPSLFEGLGIVVIEAQANGLGVVCSKAIPEECVFSPNVKRLSLDIGEKEWAEAILSMNKNRTDCYAALEAAGYDIVNAAARLQDFYLNAAKEA